MAVRSGALTSVILAALLGLVCLSGRTDRARRVLRRRWRCDSSTNSFTVRCYVSGNANTRDVMPKTRAEAVHVGDYPARQSEACANSAELRL